MSDDPVPTDPTNTIIEGDAFEAIPGLPENSVQCMVSSPPYWGQRDYQIDDQLGVEDDAADYVEKMRSIATMLKSVIVDEGSLWLNLGDTYNGGSIIRRHRSENPEKGDPGYEDQLAYNRDESGVRRRSSGQFGLPRQTRLLIPERVAMSIMDAGWLLRDRVIYKRLNPKPEGRVDSRLTQSHDLLFRFVQQEEHTFYRDRLPDPIDVWEIQTAHSRPHPAPMPAELARRCVRLTTDEDDTVLDPFCGIGTVCDVAENLNREYIGIEINPEFAAKARETTTPTPGNSLSRWTGE